MRDARFSCPGEKMDDIKLIAILAVVNRQTIGD